MMKSILFAVAFIALCFSYIIVTYSDEISEKLTYNLNRNLDVDWGDNHPKFKKQHLNVDLLDLSISWDYFNIVFPLTQGAHILNALSSIKSTGCISNIVFSLNIQIDINCNEIRIEIKKNKIYLNNKPLYQRLVLDQGFYPKGIWTAPADKDLKNDILLSMKAGFNGARLHEKVFEDRFHYWADKLGYITWAEFPNWGLNENAKGSEMSFMKEWPRIVKYLKNHPSIITWTPFNETNTVECNPQHKSLMRKAYAITKKIDPTRPVNETSGYQHQKTDIWTVHHYEPVPEKLKAALNPKKGVYRNFPHFETSYKNEPYIIDEYGGVWWLPIKLRKKIKSWGHGDKVRPKTIQEVYERMEKLTEVVLKTKHIQGCLLYTSDAADE